MSLLECDIERTHRVTGVLLINIRACDRLINTIVCSTGVNSEEEIFIHSAIGKFIEIATQTNVDDNTSYHILNTIILDEFRMHLDILKPTQVRIGRSLNELHAYVSKLLWDIAGECKYLPAVTAHGVVRHPKTFLVTKVDFINFNQLTIKFYDLARDEVVY